MARRVLPLSGMLRETRSRILVADADPSVSETVAELLESAGLETGRAANAKDAVSQLNSGAFDGMVAHVRIFRAHEGLLENQARELGIRVVLMTGSGRVGPSLRGPAVLAKPFSGQQLLEQIERAAWAD